MTSDLSREELETRRLLAAVDLANGTRPCEVAKRYMVSRTTASRWLYTVKQEGMDGMRKRTATGRPRRLTAEQLADVASICKRINPTTSERSSIIEALYKVRYHPDYVGKLAHRLMPDEKLFAGH